MVHLKRRALVIGASNYQFLGKLTYSSNDALRFKNSLVQDFKFKDDAIRFLSDSEPAAPKPTSANILSSIDSLLADPILDKGDLFILYFSGHGMGTANGDYLCATDSKPEDVEKTGLPVSTVIQKLVSAKLRNVLIIADACRAGEKNDFGSDLFDQAKQANIAVLLGCEPGQKSYESPQLKSGVFTYFLLKALTNPKTRTEFGGLWASRVAASLSNSVTEFTKRDYGDNAQRPKTFADPTSDVMLAKYVEGSKSTSVQDDQDQKMVNDPAKEADALLQKAGEMLEIKDNAAFLELSKLASSLDPSNMYAAYYASIGCTVVGRRGEQEKYCALLAKSNNPYFQNLGLVQSDSRSVSMQARLKALEDFWKSSPQDDMHAVIVWARARAYLTSQVVKRLVIGMLPRLEPKNRVAKFLRAELAISDGKTDDALHALDEALAAPDPSNSIGTTIISVDKMNVLYTAHRYADLKAYLKTQFNSEKIEPLIWASTAAYLKAIGERTAAVAIAQKGLSERAAISDDVAYLAALTVGAQIGSVSDDLDALEKASPYSWRIRLIAAIARGTKNPDINARAVSFEQATKYCDDEVEFLTALYRLNNAIYRDGVENFAIPEDKFTDSYEAFRVLYVNYADRFGSDCERWTDFIDICLSTMQGPAGLRQIKLLLKDFSPSEVMANDFYSSLFKLAASDDDDDLMAFSQRNITWDEREKNDLRVLLAGYWIVRGDYAKASTLFGQGKSSTPSFEGINEVIQLALDAHTSKDKSKLVKFLSREFKAIDGELIAEGIAAMALSDLGDNATAAPHLENLVHFHPTMLDAISSRCLERAMKIMDPDKADLLLFETLRVNRTSPGVFNSFFGKSQGIENYVGHLASEATKWFTDELYNPKNPSHKDAYQACAVGDGSVDLTIDANGAMTGKIKIVDGEALDVIATTDAMGNVRGVAKGSELTMQLYAKLPSNQFRKSETFKQSSVGIILDLVDPKGITTHWLLPYSVLKH